MKLVFVDTGALYALADRTECEPALPPPLGPPAWRTMDVMSGDGISDTSAEAARVQLELIRSASPERRLAACFGFSRSMIALSRAALRDRFPELDEAELRLRWVELNYGADLAAQVRAHLHRRGERRR